MKRTVLLLLALFIGVIISCRLPGKGTVQVRYVGERPMGYYEVTLNYNRDTDYNMGVLYGEALVSQYPTLEANFAAYFAGFEASYYDEMMTRVQLLREQIPLEYVDFLDGLASQFNGGTTNDKDDQNLSTDEIFFFNLISEVQRSTQCSVVAVYDSASGTGKPIIGRLLDWSSISHGTIYYIEKPGTKIMIIGGSLLAQSVSTGLNQDGIFVANLDAPTGEPFPDLTSNAYHSYHFDLRYALENYDTIDDVAGYLTQHQYTFNHLIAIGDTDSVKFLENNLSGARALRDSTSELNTGIPWGFSNAIAAVNAFLLKGNYDNFTYSFFNTDRWQSIIDQLTFYLAAGNAITAEEMKKITTFYGTTIDLSDGAGIMTDITQQIVIYDSANLTLQMFFRNNRDFGAADTTTTFDVDYPHFWDIPVRF